MTLNHLSSQPAALPETVASAGLTMPSGALHASGASGISSGWPVSAPPASPIDLHPALQTVRQMPEFQPPQPSWLDQLRELPAFKKLSHDMGHLWHQFWAKLWGWLSHMKPLGTSQLSAHLQNGYSYLVGAVLILVGLFVIYLVLGWLVRWREGAARKPLPPVRLLDEVLLVNAEHHYQQALRAADAAEYALALRQLYMATLCLLDERKLAPYEATRTNLEYLALLKAGLTAGAKGAPPLAEVQPAAVQDVEAMQSAFARLARHFESVRFGLQPVSVTQFEQSRVDFQVMADRTAMILNRPEGRVHG